jgi:hypothetical protein
MLKEKCTLDNWDFSKFTIMVALISKDLEFKSPY